MPTNVFEESAIGLIARAKQEDWIGETVKFEMVQSGNGAKVPDKQDTFKTLVVRYDIDKVPKVHDDEASYALEYKVTIKGRTRLSNNKYVVWPSLYDLECELENGDPAKYAEFYVSGGSNRGMVTLSADGKGQYEPEGAGAAPEFEVKSPYELVSWTQDVGRKRTATLKRKAYTAAFWTPSYTDIPDGLRFTSTAAASGQGFYQIVNLVDNALAYYGTKIRFTVGADGDARLEPAARLGKKGDKIHVKVEFDANNSKRNDHPKPGVHQKVGDPLVEAHTNTTQTFTVELGDGGAGAEFEVVLGHAGCDKVVISIGVTSACQDASYELETRRRVFYQVTRNGGQDNPNLARSDAALAKVGVKLSCYKVRSLGPTDNAPTGVSWISGNYFGGGGARLNVGNYNSGHYHGLWTDKGPNNKVVSPRLHVLYTDVQYDSWDPATSGDPDDVYEITAIDLDDTDEVDWSDGTKVVGHHVALDMADEGLFDVRLYNGASPFVSGSWETDGGATTGNFAAGDVWMQTDGFTVKLPAACTPHLTAGKTITITSVELARAQGPFLGEADDGKILCVVTQSADEIADTVTHEVGHVIGLAPSGVAPPGLNLADHTRAYVGNKHTGPHCAKGMSGADYNGGVGSGAYFQDFEGATECKCVMYGEGNDQCTGEFCNLCEPFGRAGKVT